MMEDEMGVEISGLFEELEEIAIENFYTSDREWLVCTPALAEIILENNRRKDAEIEMLRGAIEGWRRVNGEQRETIKKMRLR